MSGAPPAHDTAIIADGAARLWTRLQRREPYYRIRMGERVERLPSGSWEEAEAEASEGSDIAARLSGINRTRLSAIDAATADFVEHMAQASSRMAVEYWESFPVTPYMAIVGLSSHLRQVFVPFRFETRSDVAHYRALLDDYRRLIDSSAEKMRLLEARGWRIARPAIAGARGAMEGLAASASPSLIPDPARLAALGADAGRAGDDIARQVREAILPAIASLIGTLDADYERSAPEAPGMMHLPGGTEAYARAIHRHLTEPVSAEALHDLGRSEVARITENMAALRAREGWAKSEAEFHAELRGSPRSYSSSPEALGARYQRHIQAMEAALPRLFHRLPTAPFRIARLPAEAEGGMAYGYYEGPSRPGEPGTYYYNGANLSDRPQLTAACLILHELVPGHHFHLARQVENRALPVIRRESGELTVFNEGWAEYASGLGVEAGVYDDPIDLYGRYLHERFIAQRLVVDTGLNALGWTLDEAHIYMRAQTLEREEQIASELLRYATDWPAQSLAYHYGRARFEALRAKAATRADFDIRDFHEAILGAGALPLPALDRHLSRSLATTTGAPQ